MAIKRSEFIELLQDSPVIAAVKSDEDLKKALSSECAIIFVLYGTILNLGDIINKAKASGRIVFVHADLIEGLTGKEISADFIAETTKADGVISTRNNIIRRAKELHLLAIQRFFLLDSLAFSNVLKQANEPDIIDILPGTMPSVISRLCRQVRRPVIASGLLTEKNDIIAALDSGATAVSTSHQRTHHPQPERYGYLCPEL